MMLQPKDIVVVGMAKDGIAKQILNIALGAAKTDDQRRSKCRAVQGDLLICRCDGTNAVRLGCARIFRR